MWSLGVSFDKGEGFSDWIGLIECCEEISFDLSRLSLKEIVCNPDGIDTWSTASMLDELYKKTEMSYKKNISVH